MSNLAAALRRSVRVLADEGIPFMVIGGIANLVWGNARTTTDLDLTVRVEDERGFLEVASRIGEPLAEDPLDVAVRGRLLPVRAPDGTRVDLALATLPFEVDAIGRARTVSVLGVEVPVCSPEDLIVMKSVSDRARDHEDVIGVLRRQAGSLDLGRLDRLLEGLADDLADRSLAERWREAKQRAGAG